MAFANRSAGFFNKVLKQYSAIPRLDVCHLFFYIVDFIHHIKNYSLVLLYFWCLFLILFVKIPLYMCGVFIISYILECIFKNIRLISVFLISFVFPFLFCFLVTDAFEISYLNYRILFPDVIFYFYSVDIRSVQILSFFLACFLYACFNFLDFINFFIRLILIGFFDSLLMGVKETIKISFFIFPLLVFSSFYSSPCLCGVALEGDDFFTRDPDLKLYPEYSTLYFTDAVMRSLRGIVYGQQLVVTVSAQRDAHLDFYNLFVIPPLNISQTSNEVQAWHIGTKVPLRLFAAFGNVYGVPNPLYMPEIPTSLALNKFYNFIGLNKPLGCCSFPAVPASFLQQALWFAYSKELPSLESFGYCYPASVYTLLHSEVKVRFSLWVVIFLSKEASLNLSLLQLLHISSVFFGSNLATDLKFLSSQGPEVHTSLNVLFLFNDFSGGNFAFDKNLEKICNYFLPKIGEASYTNFLREPSSTFEFLLGHEHRIAQKNVSFVLEQESLSQLGRLRCSPQFLLSNTDDVTTFGSGPFIGAALSCGGNSTLAHSCGFLFKWF